MEFDDIVKGRRSIRQYSQKEVSRELLEEILESALWAPSGMNRQEWSLVAVCGPMRDRLVEIISKSQEFILPHLQQSFSEKIIKISLQVFSNLGGAPAVILVYVPKEKISWQVPLDGRSRYHAEFNRFNRLLSASALIQNLLLAAHKSGLGTCWMTGPKYMEKEISELFGMNDKELVSVIPIGYPDQAPPAPPRKEGTVKWVGF
jgi:nitroreductase